MSHDAETIAYDGVLGTFRGAVAYSNRDDEYFSGENHYMNGVYCGFKWQCVEYARRYLLHTKGAIFGQCGRASEIFDMKVITNVETGEEFEFKQCTNKKSTTPPRAGDVLIYPFVPDQTPWGHVAVISYVSEDLKVAGIAEQNQHFYRFEGHGENPHCYGRTVEIKKNEEDGTYELVEDSNGEMPACSGWMDPSACPDRPNFLAPLNPKPEFTGGSHGDDKQLALEAYEHPTGPWKPSREELTTFRKAEKAESENSETESPMDALFKKLDDKYIATYANAQDGEASFDSVMYPKNSLGEKVVGCCTATNRLVTALLRLIILREGASGFTKDELQEALKKVSTISDNANQDVVTLFTSTNAAEVSKAIAQVFNIPETVIPHLIADTKATLSAPAKDSLFQTVRFGFDEKTLFPYLHEVNLDHPTDLIHTNEYGAAFSHVAGRTEGFAAFGVGRDTFRLVKRYLRHYKPSVIHVLGSFRKEQDAKEDLSALHLYTYISGIKAKMAEMMKDAAPQFDVKIVEKPLAELKRDGDNLIDADGVSVVFALNVTPWATIFNNADAMSLLGYNNAASTNQNLRIMSPLWTSLVSGSSGTAATFKQLLDVYGQLQVEKASHIEGDGGNASPTSAANAAEAQDFLIEIADSYSRIVPANGGLVSAAGDLPNHSNVVKFLPPNKKDDEKEAKEAIVPPAFHSCGLIYCAGMDGSSYCFESYRPNKDGKLAKHGNSILRFIV